MFPAQTITRGDLGRKLLQIPLPLTRSIAPRGGAPISTLAFHCWMPFTSLEGTKYSRRWLSTPPQTVDTIPSNLIFDLRSSFAPRVHETQAFPTSIETDTLPEDEDRESSAVSPDELEMTEKEQDSFNDEIIESNYSRFDVPQFVIPLPDRLKTDVYYSTDGSISGTLHLDESVFGIDPVRIDLIKQSVDFIRNKIRGKRKAKTKTVSEVRGSGRKVRQQKGTGSARAGHSRPAHWRGGAKAHGPKNTTDYGNVKMNKKTKRLALSSVLSQKLKEGNLIIVDNLRLNSHKTQPWAKLLSDVFDVGMSGSSALIVDDYNGNDDNINGDDEASHTSYQGVPINLWVASSNIPKVKVVNQSFANVYEIMKKEKLIITLSALQTFEERLRQ